MGRMKGSIVVGVIKRAKREPGALELLSPEDRDFVIHTRIHTSQWYPMDVLERVTLAIEKVVVGRNDGSLLWSFGREMAKVQLTGLYAVFRVDGDPQRQIERVPTIWKAFYDDGNWSVTRIGDGHIELALSDTTATTPVLCLSAGGFLEEACRMAGGPDVTLEKSACRLQGADACRYVLTW
jgi:predicted hydrocarbon binding protein